MAPESNPYPLEGPPLAGAAGDAFMSSLLADLMSDWSEDEPAEQEAAAPVPPGPELALAMLDTLAPRDYHAPDREVHSPAGSALPSVKPAESADPPPVPPGEAPQVAPWRTGTARHPVGQDSGYFARLAPGAARVQAGSPSTTTNPAPQTPASPAPALAAQPSPGPDAPGAVRTTPPFASRPTASAPLAPAVPPSAAPPSSSGSPVSIPPATRVDPQAAPPPVHAALPPPAPASPEPASPASTLPAPGLAPHEPPPVHAALPPSLPSPELAARASIVSAPPLAPQGAPPTVHVVLPPPAAPSPELSTPVLPGTAPPLDLQAAPPTAHAASHPPALLSPEHSTPASILSAPSLDPLAAAPAVQAAVLLTALPPLATQTQPPPDSPARPAEATTPMSPLGAGYCWPESPQSIDPPARPFARSGAREVQPSTEDPAERFEFGYPVRNPEAVSRSSRSVPRLDVEPVERAAELESFLLVQAVAPVREEPPIPDPVVRVTPDETATALEAPAQSSDPEPWTAPDSAGARRTEPPEIAMAGGAAESGVNGEDPSWPDPLALLDERWRDGELTPHVSAAAEVKPEPPAHPTPAPSRAIGAIAEGDLHDLIRTMDSELAAQPAPDSPAPVPSANEKRVSMVLFGLHGVSYALGIEHIVETDRAPKTTIVPGVPGFVRGVMNLRGEIVPVVDLGLLLGFGPVETAGRLLVTRGSSGSLTGLIVERVDGMISLARPAIRPVPATLGEQANMLAGLGDHQGRLVNVLDLAKLLSAAGDGGPLN